MNICVTYDHGYIPPCHIHFQVLSFPHSWLITRFVTRVTRWVPLVEQELLTLQEHPSSPLDFSGVRVTRSVVFCEVFCTSLFILLSFFFWPLHCLYLFFYLWIMISPLVSSNSFYYSPNCTDCILPVLIETRCLLDLLSGIQHHI